MRNLQIAPRFDDSLTYLYAEHVRVDREKSSIALWDDNGITEIPIAAIRVLHQAGMVSDPHAHMTVVRRMYQCRFGETLPDDLDIQQIRGREGQRVRSAYRRLSAEAGVPWHGRDYDRQSWGHADPINRAISAANSCLYGLRHAAKDSRMRIGQEGLCEEDMFDGKTEISRGGAVGRCGIRR